MKSMLVLSLAIISSAAQAALPPGAESLRRIAAVATSPEVFQVVGSATWVKSITDNGDNSYSVLTKDCRLLVKVEVLPIEHPGPGVLKITPGRMDCLPHR